MKQTVLLASVLSAGFGFAAVDTNVIGAMKIPTGTAKQQLVAVPFAGYDGGAVKVDDMVTTAGLAVGSKLYVANGDTYNVWQLGSDGQWQATTTVNVSASGVSEVPGTKSSDAEVAVGSAFWIEPADGSSAAYLLGQKPDSAATSTTVADAWNMIGNASVSQKTLTFQVLPAVAGDRILVSTASGMREYQYKAGDGKGWYYETWSGGTPTKHYESPVIDAGAGFWYYSATAKTIAW